MDRNKAIEVLKDFWSVYEIGTENREAFETLIPELKESKDERIRKEIISYIKSSGAVTNPNWIAWLEKQGEPVVYDRDNYNSAKEKAWNCKSFSDDSSRKSIFLEGFQDGYQFGIHEEKPHRWTWHDEAVRKEAIACLEDWENQFPINSIDYRNVLNWLKNELTIHTEEKQGSQNLANSAKTCKDEQNLAWSEEDEKRFESTLHRMEIVGNGCAFGQLKDDIEWLKSLKERYTWKPSDEQIE